MKYKILKTLVAVTIVFNIISCQEDPLDDAISNDRQVLSFNIDGQVGPAIIKSIDDSEGVIDVFVIENNIDLNNVKPLLEVSEFAQVSPASEEIIDFTKNGNSFVYEVISQSGKVRNWTVNLKPFISEIDGEWKVSSFIYDWQIGLNVDWGWGVFGTYDPATNSYDANNYQPVPLADDFPNAALEQDNELSIITTLVNENGNPEGTFDFSAGADIQYSTFILASDHEGNVRSYTNRFRKMPIGTGVWEYNVGGKTLTLWQGNKSGKQSVGRVLVAQSGDISITFDVWENMFTWDHWGAESHIQNAYTIYYNFVSK
jgi:hypothetical protein